MSRSSLRQPDLVVTGVSGSGKTSLVFDTLYHEARRRFLEIFSLGSAGLRLSPAKVGAIAGLGPAVAVGQNLLNRNPASALATASGLHPFLRLLYARFDLALLLGLCWRVGASREDARVAEAVEFVRGLQGPYGLWEYASRPQASRWVTFDLLRSLSRLDAATDWLSLEPRTPFQMYPKKVKRF